MTESPLKLVVVGGGVAGVCCVEELEALLADQRVLGNRSREQVEIILIAGHAGFIKTVTHAEKVDERFVSGMNRSIITVQLFS